MNCITPNRLRKWMLMSSALLWIGMICGCQVKENEEKSVLVNIWPDQPIGTDFIGNGVQWSAYPHADATDAEWGYLMTPEKWETIYQRLDYMQPQFIRVMDLASWRYYKGLDSQGEPIIDFTTQEVRSLYKLLDYCQRKDVTVVFGEWGTPPGITGANNPRWIRMIVAYLNHLIIEKGYTCLKIYNLVNEPNGYWATTDGNWQEWKEGVVMLDSALKAGGLHKYISISGPGTVPQYDHPKSQIEGRLWLQNTVDQLDSCISHYEIHAYINQESIRKGTYLDNLIPGNMLETVHTANKPFFLGEIGLKEFDGPLKKLNDKRIEEDPYASEDSNMRVYDFEYGVDLVDATIQAMNAGIDGVIVWDLDDAMHTLGDTGETSKLKRWGFWNILGSEICKNAKDEEIRPGYYPWSWMNKYFLKGSSILRSDPISVPGLRMVTGKNGNDYSIAVVNNSDIAQNLLLKFQGTHATRTFRSWQYFQTNYDRTNNKLTIPELKKKEDLAKGISVALPPFSVVVLTTIATR